MGMREWLENGDQSDVSEIDPSDAQRWYVLGRAYMVGRK